MIGTILAAVLVFQVSWLDMSDNEEGFYIYRDGEKIATVPALPTIASSGVPMTYDDTAVEYGTQYCYQVASFNHNSAGDEQTGMSGQACIQVEQPAQFMPPAAPTMGTVTQK